MQKAGDWVYTASELVGGGLTASSGLSHVKAGIAAFPEGIPLIIGGGIELAHGGNSVYNGVRDFKHVVHGNYNSVGNQNWLADNVYKPIGKKIGGYKGEKIAEIVYYVVDIGTGIGGTAKIITGFNKVQKTGYAFKTIGLTTKFGTFTELVGNKVIIDATKLDKLKKVLVVTKDGIGYYIDTRSGKGVVQCLISKSAKKTNEKAKSKSKK